MKKLLMTALAAFALAATPALAEGTTGVVNVAKIMQSSKAATSVRTQLQAKQKSFQAELDAKEKELLNEDQALVKQKDMADKAAFEKKVKDFRAKAANEQREVQSKKAQLDKSFAGALDEIQKTVFEIVKQVAAEKKLNLVVSSSQVLYADPALDITEDVLKRLDTKLPSVAVKF
ncbi:MAG: OmpH family outer membrane protein [Alphaproteobacteria bacterium]|nr:OmpH family outer membrane protein [Alphaproteobacteria bacterium]